MKRDMRSTKGYFGKCAAVALTLTLFLALSACFDNAANDSPDSGASSSSVAASSTTEEPSKEPSSTNDDIIAELFEDQKSGVQVEGTGTVLRLLEDDTDGDKHQRFILELNSGQTLLVAHNIDVAPRLEGLAAGDTVGFYGEYYYNEQGGGIHWTHHDASKQHEDGWLFWDGNYYG